MPSAEINEHEIKNGMLIMAKVKKGFFTRPNVLKIIFKKRRHRSDTLSKIECELTQKLAGIVERIETLPADNKDVKSQLINKVKSINIELPFQAEPLITAEFQEVLKELSQTGDALLYVHPNPTLKRSKVPYFADKDFNLILDEEGHSEVSKLEVKVDDRYRPLEEVHYDKEQLLRKANSEDFMHLNNIIVYKHLPCMPKVEHMSIRSVTEIIQRAYCLLIVALYGEGESRQNIMRMIIELGVTGFTPQEMELLYKETLTRKERSDSAWRYEALNALLWALQKVEVLSFPSDICSVEGILGLMVHKSVDQFNSDCELRAKDQIVDYLDKIYRIHWTCVEERMHTQLDPHDVHPRIVFERYYALRWLMMYQNRDWDEIQDVM